MAKGRNAPPILPARWRGFIRRFGSNRAYWYAPKGLAATPEAIKARLQLLKQFEGARAWREVQSEYIAALKSAGVSDAESAWPEGGAPLARMLKQVFNVLGLAWTNDTDRVEITKAGNKFLESETPSDVLSEQMSRYQFWNPAVRSREHQVIRVHPIPFLAETLRSLDPPHLSATEYTLFIAHASSQREVDDAVESIFAFRELSDDEQGELRRRCDAFMLGGERRSSIYNTITLNRSYAFGMWTLSNLIDRDQTGGLMLARDHLRQYRAYLEQFAKDGVYIDFESQKDWIAYMGDPDAKPTTEIALSYYASKGNISEAVALKKSQNATAKEIKEFRDMLVSERQVEDYLVENLDFIGKQIKADLVLVDGGRQYDTTVGTIDLLARDRATSQYVVIELKKGRSADRVYGQTSRYMGWVRKNLANDAEVMGVIVARKIDEKLMAARDAHDTKVHLIEFEMRIGSRKV